jgi:hypothetical protein
MNTELKAGRTVPGRVISIKVAQPAAAGSASTTTATVLASFHAIKEVLSDKPLRRPNRLRPIH